MVECKNTRAFVGAMKIARNVAVFGRYVEWYSPHPGSLPEGAVERSETEGVSSDGSSMPTVYPPAHMNSENFERLRSPKYTPSASLRSAAPSEREPGTVGLHHSPCRPETATLRAIFIAPTKLKSVYIPPFNRGRAIFIAPTETQKILHSTVWKEKRKKYGYFGTAQWD